VKLISPSTLYAFEITRVSSAKSLIVLGVTQFTMSLINKTKNVGPSTLHCGTPEVTGAKSEDTPSMTTSCERPVKNDDTHQKIQGFIFSNINLFTSM